MANVHKISTLMSKQMVQSLHARGKLINTVDKGLSGDFTQKKYTPGTTVYYPIEFQPSVTTGRVANVQDVVQLQDSLTIVQYNTAESFTSIEKTYNMDNPKDIRRYADRMALALVRKIETVGFQHAAINCGNNVGTPGVDTGSLKTWAEGRARMSDALVPDREIYAAINPMGNVALTDALKGATNPGKQISNQYLRYQMKRAAGMNFYESNSIYRHTAGTTTDFAGAVTTTSVDGATSIVLKSLGTGTITAGTKYTIAGVYNVDPETFATLSTLKEFTVLNTETIAGNAATVDLPRAIYGPDSANGHQNVSALPVADAVVTFTNSGSASTVDAMNLIYDRDAIKLVSVPLMKARGNWHTFSSYEGIQIRIGIGAWDLTNDEQGIRCDAVAGWGNGQIDHMCVVWGD